MKQRTRQMHCGDDLSTYTMLPSTDDDGNIPLHKMRQPEHYIEAQVQESDTLQAIALRFYCPVSELKRINQIHKDNEIFARRTIKVPVTPYSVLTELVPLPQPIQETESHVPSDTVLVKEAEKPISEEDFSLDCNEVVMNSVMAPSTIIYTDDPNFTEPMTEDTQLLPKEKPLVETVVVKQLTSQGADWGIKWFHLLGCMLVLGVVLPLIYVLFYLEKHEHSDVPPLQDST